MSRFDHLEMGNWPTQEPEGKPEGPAVVDQHYYLEKADEAFAEESYERALAYYSRALQYDLSAEEAWLGQLRCLIELQELPEAVVWSDRALQRFPSSGGILAARGVAEGRLGRPIAALGYVDAAFQAQTATPYAWIARGEVLIPTSAANAKACFLKAVEMAPQDWHVRAWIARSYLARGLHHQALEHLRHAVRLDPDRAESWYWIGKCCEAFGDIEEAKRSYCRAYTSRPGFTRARSALHELENRGAVSKIGGMIRRLFRRRLTSEG